MISFMSSINHSAYYLRLHEMTECFIPASGRFATREFSHCLMICHDSGLLSMPIRHYEHQSVSKRAAFHFRQHGVDDMLMMEPIAGGR